MVQIQAKQERSVWANAVRNSIPDLFVAGTGSYFFDWGVPGFFGILLGLQALYFFIWIKNMIWGWLLYWLGGKRKLVEHLEDFLYKNRFPQPPEFVGGIDDYLAQVSNDKNLHPILRVKAATELGTLSGIKAAGRIMMGMQMHFAYEEALEAYSRRFPPRINDQE